MSHGSEGEEDASLDLGDVVRPPSVRVLALDPRRLLRGVPAATRRHAAVAAVLVASVGLCAGAGPLPDPGSDVLELVAAPQELDRSPAPDVDPVGPPTRRGAELLALRVPVAVVPMAVPVVAVPPPPELSALAMSGIPAAALTAYRRAAASMARADRSCHLDWSLLAGIGRVETNHGQFGGRRPTVDGAVVPPILGLVLDGRPGTATITDTDGGLLDGDPVYDRAVGPMQFIPGTWARWGADGDGDGTADPHDLDDAALAAGRYLCAGDRDLGTAEGRAAAVFSYNHSEAYVALVTALADAYAAGTALSGPPPLAVPVPAGPVGLRADPASVSAPVVAPVDAAPVEPAPSPEPTAPPTTPPTTEPTPTPTDEPTEPAPTCTPGPSESPSPADGPTPSPTGSPSPTPSETSPAPTCPGVTDGPTSPVSPAP